MALVNKTRFIAAATLIAALAATPALARSGAESSGPLQFAEAKMGKEIRVEEALKGQQGGGDGGGFGVERPAPEGRDPNVVEGGGERSLDGGGSAGGKAAAKGGKPAAGKEHNPSGDNGDGDDLPPGDL
jgi:hypothetical protein